MSELIKEGLYMLVFVVVMYNIMHLYFKYVDPYMPEIPDLSWW